MKILAKLALGAALLSSVAMTAAPADAGVVVRVGGFHHRHHGPVIVVGPRVGVFYAGRGWWDGRRYWGHRYHWHGHWRYR